MTFGDRVRDLRKERKMTQAKLSALSGIAIPNISRMESGKYNPSKKTKQAIARSFDISEAELMLPIYEATVADLRMQKERMAVYMPKGAG